MKRFFTLVFFGIFACCPLLFTACSLGETTEKTVINYTDPDNLKGAINSALLSSVLIQAQDGLGHGGSGSGVIHTIEGASTMYIITNWHVIARDANNGDATPAGYYTVSPASALEMGSQGYPVVNPLYRAETNQNRPGDDQDNVVLVGGSAYYDIAILKVTGTDLIDPFNLKEATVSDARLAYGDTAFAIGNSLGLGISATEGIVSVPSEYVADKEIAADEDGNEIYMERRVIRTTAAVQQGNSGGGLFDGRGELIGIVQSKPFYTGQDNLPVDNIAYAVPTDIAVRIAIQMEGRDRAGEFTGFYNPDCLETPTVGIELGTKNRRADDSDDSAVYYIDDIFVHDIYYEMCQVDDIEINDVIRGVRVSRNGSEIGKLETITAVYQIREFLIEHYNADSIAFIVERNGTLINDYSVSGPFALPAA